MRQTILRSAAVTVLVLVSSAVAADVVYLRSGGKIEGRITASNEAGVTIEVAGGTMTLSQASIERVERGHSSLDAYEDRAQGLAEDDVEGWLAIARWADNKRLGTQSLDAYEHVLTIDPTNPEAHRAMGRIEHNGRWLEPEEAYRELGYVRFEGRWMPPEERQVILSERQRRAELTRARLQALATAHRAEAQAREAEARAREAEARERLYAIPYFWYPLRHGGVVPPPSDDQLEAPFVSSESAPRDD